jgi:hypothetical protein
LPRAGGEDEAEGSGAEADGHRCIFVIGYTADFYSYVVHYIQSFRGSGFTVQGFFFHRSCSKANII